MKNHLRNTILTGIFAAIPLAVTIFVIVYVERATREPVRNLTGWNTPFIGILIAIAAIYLLAPQISLLFMGEEFGASTPFLYFCDFHGELGRAVSEGRRKEFSQFACFGESVPPDIPDPNDDGTFEASRLDWSTIARAPHSRWLAHYRELLALRRQHIVPLLPDIASGHRWDALADVGLQVRWQLRDGGALLLDAQLSDAEARRDFPAGRPIYELRPSPDPSILLPWSVRWAI